MKTKILSALVLISASHFLTAAPIAPIGKDGRKLNLDFEAGSLTDWKLDGNAFEGQPVQGDTVAKRNGPGGTSAHQGQYWIGGYEISGDDLTGSLSSVPFKVTQPWASFLVAGGHWPETRVELVDAENQKAFFKVSGEDSEHLRPVVVDLKDRVGKEIFIRIVDEQKGGWGHINFGDFKFYSERPKFADEIDLAKRQSVPEPDKVLYQGLSPEDAAAKMTLPPGFKATLFAGEPDVKQPIAFAIDDRGRLWVAEAYTYPIRTGVAPLGKSSEPTPEQLKDIFGGKDRIICFEDTDGDGKFDKRTVVVENLNLISGLEIGFGGIYVGAAPYLMYFKIQDGDEPKSVGNPQILLDGWDYKRDTHETLNSFKWGPDGWLYGCHGVFCPSLVGKPGATESERQWMDAGIWRYHPTKHIFEVFAEGTSNPWGFDFDEHGQLIEEACVIPHLWHMIQGGRYQRQGGEHFTINSEETARNEKFRDANSRKPIFPYVYDDIKTIADHVHYAGDKGPHAGNGRSAAAGGGHAHAGLLIYQGDNWPEEYRGKYFMNNIHGACINEDVPERKGSGFVGHHAPNLINFNDTWSQIINLQSGPDGAVYMIDWYDKNQCHHNDPNGHDRTNGRIFKISYGDTKFEKVDLQKLSDEKLFAKIFEKNIWEFQHALRIFHERTADGSISQETMGWFMWAASLAIHAKELGIADLSKSSEIEKAINSQRAPTPEQMNLRLLWTGYASLSDHDESDLPDDFHIQPGISEYSRAWSIQFLCENKKVLPVVLKEFARLAREDKSPVVRLYLASALQRLPLTNRWEILENLYAHSEDVDDHNIPLMLWYAAEPLAAQNPKRALEMAEKTKLPNLLNFTVRRVAALGTTDAMMEIVNSLVAVSRESASKQNSAAQTLEILNGLSTALKGQRSVTMPLGWIDVEKNLGKSSNTEIRAQVQSLSLTFGSSRALASLKNTLMDDKADAAARRTALDSLLNAKDKDLAPLLQQLLGDAALRGQALRGLAAYDDSQTPQKIIAAYNSFSPTEKRDALNTLSSRVAFAKALLTAVGDNKIPRKDLTADLIRQLGNLKNVELQQQLGKVWGAVRELSADKKQSIEKYRKIYRAGGSQPGDAARGRLVFSKTCQQCHTLFDTGGKVGPDLTGSNRGDLDYILQNMVDPNAVIPNEYRASTLETKDDRVITGIVKAQDENSVTMITPNETVTVPRKEIQSLKQNELSMMPEGLLDALGEQEVRDLIYYLGRPGQVPLPK